MKLFVQFLTSVILALVLFALPAHGGPRVFALSTAQLPSVASTGDSLKITVSDTCTYVNTERCNDLQFQVVGDADSVSVAIQGSVDSGTPTTWFTLSAAKTVVGTHGTVTALWWSPLVRNANAGAVSSGYTDFKMAPPTFVRMIFKNVSHTYAAKKIKALLYCN